MAASRISNLLLHRTPGGCACSGINTTNGYLSEARVLLWCAEGNNAGSTGPDRSTRSGVEFAEEFGGFRRGENSFVFKDLQELPGEVHIRFWRALRDGGGSNGGRRGFGGRRSALESRYEAVHLRRRALGIRGGRSNWCGARECRCIHNHSAQYGRLEATTELAHDAKT